MRLKRMYWFMRPFCVLNGAIATAALCSSDGLGGGGVDGGLGPTPLGEGPLGAFASTSLTTDSDGCSHLSVAGSNTFTVLERAPNTYLPPTTPRRNEYVEQTDEGHRVNSRGAGRRLRVSERTGRRPCRCTSSEPRTPHSAASTDAREALLRP